MANKYSPAAYAGGGTAKKPAGAMTPYSVTPGVAGAHAFTPEMFIPDSARKGILDKTNPYGATGAGGNFKFAKENPYSRAAINAANATAGASAEPAASWKGSQEWANANRAVQGAKQTVWNNDQNGASAANFDQGRYQAALTALEEARGARKAAKADFRAANQPAPAELQEFDRARADQWRANQQVKAERWDARQAKAQKQYDKAFSAAEAQAEAAAAAQDQLNKQYAVNTDRMNIATDKTSDLAATTDAQGPAGRLRNRTKVGENTLGVDFSKDRRRVENALMRRINAQMDKDREAQQSQLLNAGIGYGTQAYGAAQDDMNRAALDARIGAILSAGQEQSRMRGDALAQGTYNLGVQQQAFNQALQRDQSQLARQQQAFGQNVTVDQAGLQRENQNFSQRQAARADQRGAQSQAYNQALTAHQGLQSDRSAALQEQIALRNQQINEITALMSGGQVQTPNFAVHTPGAMPTVDQAGLINANYDQRLQAWQQDQANRQSMIGGLLGFGAGILNPVG